MGHIVAKFGGTSLADTAHFQQVRAITNANRNRRYIIPSAPGIRGIGDCKITDLLFDCYCCIERSLPFSQQFRLVAERFMQLASELQLVINIEQELAAIEVACKTGSASREYLVSRGEYLNGLILAELLDCPCVDPGRLILFHGDGTVNLEASYNATRSVLKEYERAVIPGFYGAKSDGSVCTFSRGGSDVTGALIARATGADLYENWTDVAGFLVADPRIVPQARLISHISYRELRELAYMGARVLHEEAVFPVRSAGIPINIRNTNAPEQQGTMIVPDHSLASAGGSITGIAGRKDFTIISLEKALMHSQLGFIRRLLSVMEAYQISIEHIPTGIDTVSLVVLDSQLHGKLEDVLRDIERDLQPDTLEVVRDIALIATVGQGMAYTRGMAGRVFTALAKAGINIRMIDQGSSEINIITGIAASDFEDAIRAIYSEFIQ